VGRRRVKEDWGPGGHLRWLGAIIVLVILGTMGLFLVAGQPVVGADKVSNVYAMDSIGAGLNVTDVTDTSDGYISFTLSGDAAVLKIEYSEMWSDLKGSFSHLAIDIGKLEYSTIWKIAKIYVTDGSTDVYLGAIDYDNYEEAKMISVEQDDIKLLDDIKKATVVIKFYDANGNLVNAVKSGEQKLRADFVIAAERGTLTSYFTATFLAFIAALRKIIRGLTTGLTAFFLAVTTNSALLVIFGALGMLMLWFFLEQGKLRW